jgi:hypothetical protein
MTAPKLEIIWIFILGNLMSKKIDINLVKKAKGKEISGSPDILPHGLALENCFPRQECQRP